MTQLLIALLTDILLAADGVPVTVRLLDVPRHELVDGKPPEYALEWARNLVARRLGSPDPAT